jgi:hypothetical protein
MLSAARLLPMSGAPLHLLIALRQRLLLLPEAISAAGPEKQKPKPKKVVAKRK